MTSSIRQFWQQLSENVHPEDRAVFDAQPRHAFNLNYPPPAFIGDVDNAPIVVLMSNGAYKPGMTEAEFPDTSSEIEYREWLRGERRQLPDRLSSYYLNQGLGDWIRAGQAVIVNAVPYRSVKLSSKDEKLNQEVALALRSREMHRKWLAQEVLPQAALGKRFVFVHRNRWWSVPRHCESNCVIFSDHMKAEPNRPLPDRKKLDLADGWLRRRR